MAGRTPSDIGPATREKLSSGPRDMADRGGPKPPGEQVTSTRMPLNRKPHPVANLETSARMGTVQVESTRCDLRRGDSDPYGRQSAIDPGLNTGIKTGARSSKKGATRY